VGQKNAGLMAAAVMALSDDKIAKNLDAWRAANSASIAEKPTDDA
jgi:5-(carboxyamino)imidazole ribonucleotide mutase